MSDPKLILPEVFPGTIEGFRALMQRLRIYYPEGWVSANNERLQFGEMPHWTRDLVWEGSSVKVEIADDTPANRGSWGVWFLGRTDEERHAGIEAYEEQPGQTQVVFRDGYNREFPSGDYPPIGAAFEEFCEMIVKETQAASGEQDELQADSGAVAEQMMPAEDEGGKMEIFFAYAREDETLRDELEKHLSMLKREGVITSWHDRKIGAGKEWEGDIDTHLNTARVILLLVSSDFVASDYCWDVEVKRAMERHEAGEARVIPIILRPVDWKSAPFGKLQALPTDPKPVTSWSDRDEAFFDVAQGIRAAVMELRAEDNGGELRQPAAH